MPTCWAGGEGAEGTSSKTHGEATRAGAGKVETDRRGEACPLAGEARGEEAGEPAACAGACATSSATGAWSTAGEAQAGTPPREMAHERSGEVSRLRTWPMGATRWAVALDQVRGASTTSARDERDFGALAAL